jgi:hypothetical protein
MNSSTTNGSHHGDYYINGADLIIRVEDILFRVHRYFFIRDSEFFRKKLPHPQSPGDSAKEGSSDSNPLVLDDALKVDFERFLWVFYNPKYSLYDASVEDWTAILKLASQWDFIEVKALAIRELENLQIPPLPKIVLYQKYAIDRKLLQPALTALTMRDEPLTIDEGRELTLETALELAKAREIARSPVFKKSGNPRSPVNLAGVELDALINDVFHLPSSIGPDPSISQTSTGSGTHQPNTQTNSHQFTEGSTGHTGNGTSKNGVNRRN